jgi:hypothetical protein
MTGGPCLAPPMEKDGLLTSMHTIAGRQVSAVDCDVIAQAMFRANPAEIPALRKAPGGSTVPAALLRHSDEQTVVGLAAVLRAIREGGLDPDGFGEWAVLAAPRFLGRAAFERAFPQFRAEGAWGVSPHLIPAHSLHSPSGTISQALKAHGPNLGVGGTPGGEHEALLFAATLLQAEASPGVWVVLTGRVDERDGSEPSGDYEALALALTAPTSASEGPRLRISPGDVQFLRAPDAAGLSVADWLVPGLRRSDEARPLGPIPRPHFRPNRTGRPSGSRDLS